jgi:carboxymethylenebutenolidase
MRLGAFLLALLWTVPALAADAKPAAKTAYAGKMIQIPAGDDKIGAYLVEPVGGTALGNLVVVHEWWGLNDWVKRTADRFAAQGFRVLAPDLYRGKVATTEEQAHELSRGLPDDRAITDIQAAANYLRPPSSGPRLRKNGVIGFCMGGGFALKASLENTPFDATVVCYGAPVLSPTRLQHLRGPLLGIYGKEDQGITPDDVKKLEAMGHAAGRNVRTMEFDGVGHAFLNDTRADYKGDIAGQAWSQIDAFLANNVLKGWK